MRHKPSYHLSYSRSGNVGRTILAAAAAATVLILAACTDGGPSEKTITAPGSTRAATTSSGGLAFSGQIQVCVDASSPAGTYKFTNSGWNSGLALDGVTPDAGDGGDALAPNNGTTVWNPAKFSSTEYAVGVGSCFLTVNRTAPALHMFSFDPINGFGPTNSDDYQAVNITATTIPPGVIYTGTNCVADVGVILPQPNPCGAGNNPTRAFTNFVHGVQVTFVFGQAPTTIPLFVIGDLTNHGIGDVVNFWDSQWWKKNPMSLFTTKGWESFKGYASSVNLTPSAGNPCGTWTSRVGNSPPPPDVIPEFVGIIVTNNVIKIGPGEGGGIQEIIVVRSDGKYGPAPGHRGAGEVVSIQCPQV